MALVTEVDEVGRAQPVGEFVHTDAMISHRVRAKQILRTHPETRALIGRNPWTFGIIVATTALQFAIAFAVPTQPAGAGAEPPFGSRAGTARCRGFERERGGGP